MNLYTPPLHSHNVYYTKRLFLDTDHHTPGLHKEKNRLTAQQKILYSLPPQEVSSGEDPI